MLVLHTSIEDDVFIIQHAGEAIAIRVHAPNIKVAFSGPKSFHVVRSQLLPAEENPYRAVVDLELEGKNGS